MYHILEKIFVTICYYTRFDKLDNLEKKTPIEQKHKDIEHNLSTKKKDLFECHNCFLQKIDKLVKIRSKLVAFCGETCYNEWLSENNIYK